MPSPQVQNIAFPMRFGISFTHKHSFRSLKMDLFWKTPFRVKIFRNCNIVYGQNSAGVNLASRSFCMLPYKYTVTLPLLLKKRGIRVSNGGHCYIIQHSHATDPCQFWMRPSWIATSR